jgi:O-acetyl-ADP-ribose deacetylase (regulator of RNase III)
MKSEYKIGNGKIELIQGSITKYPADALVCPANTDLEMVAYPGKVQYAFLVDGGKEIFKEASTLGEKLRQMSMDAAFPMSVPETSAHLTNAGRLPAKYVIHSVAVGYDPKKDGLYCNADVIARSTRNALDLAKEKGLQSVGFPALGTGLYAVPLEEAVEAMTEEFSRHLKGQTSIERLGLVLYSPADYFIGKAITDRKFGSK